MVASTIIIPVAEKRYEMPPTAPTSNISSSTRATKVASNLFSFSIVKNTLVKNTLEKSANANNAAKLSDKKSSITKIGGVSIEGYDSLNMTEKENLKTQLSSYKTKIKESIKNGNFEKLINKAFGGKVDNPEKLKELMSAVKKGEWDQVIPTIKIAGNEVFGTAKDSTGKPVEALGAYVKDTDSIILSKDLLNGKASENGKPISFERVLTEEVAHAWDARLNNTDSAGDEGEAFTLLLEKQKLLDSPNSDPSKIQDIQQKIDSALSQKDSGTLKINGKKVEVEFFFKKLKKIGKKVVKKVKKVAKKGVKLVKKGVKTLKKIRNKIKDIVKKVVASPFFSAILGVATFFFPVLAVAQPYITAIKAAMALKEGNLSGVLGAVAGANFLPAGAQTAINTAQKVNSLRNLKDNPAALLGIAGNNIKIPAGLQNTINTAKQVNNLRNAINNPAALAGVVANNINVPAGLQNTINTAKKITPIINTVNTLRAARNNPLSLAGQALNIAGISDNSDTAKINGAVALAQKIKQVRDAQKSINTFSAPNIVTATPTLPVALSNKIDNLSEADKTLLALQLQALLEGNQNPNNGLNNLGFA